MIHPLDDPQRVTDLTLGFDLGAELAYCRRLGAVGGPPRVQSVFDGPRAARLLQALLCTGRFHELDEDWKASVQEGIERGTLAPPEWN